MRSPPGEFFGFSAAHGPVDDEGHNASAAEWSRPGPGVRLVRGPHTTGSGNSFLPAAHGPVNDEGHLASAAEESRTERGVPPARRKRTHRQTVIRVGKGDDSSSLLYLSGQLERGFDCVRSGRTAELHLVR